MDQDWADGLHRRIAAAIKRARGARSAQWLADETERLGFPISRAAIDDNDLAHEAFDRRWNQCGQAGGQVPLDIQSRNNDRDHW